MPAKYWNLMTREELSAELGQVVVIIPTAATEQHGPHLPTGHDTLAIEEVSRRAGNRASSQVPVIVTPPVAFGSSAHHVPFGGTLSLQSETYFSVIRQLVTSVLDGGGSRVLILNGHGGNHEINQLVARDVVLEWQSMGATIALGAASYWELSSASLRAIPELAGVRLPGHAGQFETATMLAQRPELVRQPIAPRAADPAPGAIAPGLRFELGFAWQAFDGFTDRPHLATAELGRQILDVVERDVAAAIVAFARTGEVDSRPKGFRKRDSGKAEG